MSRVLEARDQRKFARQKGPLTSVVDIVVRDFTDATFVMGADSIAVHLSALGSTILYQSKLVRPFFVVKVYVQ